MRNLGYFGKSAITGLAVLGRILSTGVEFGLFVAEVYCLVQHFVGNGAKMSLAVGEAGPALLAMVLILGMLGFILFGGGKAVGVKEVMDETSYERDVSPTPCTSPKR